MFIPLWIFEVIAALYLGVGFAHCVSVTFSGPKLPSFTEYLTCLFLWPVLHLR